MSKFMQSLRHFHPAVKLRRKLTGPKRPAWSTQFETLAAGLWLYGKAMPFLSAPAKRRAAEMTPVNPEELRDIKRERVAVTGPGGPLHGEWFRPAGVKTDRVICYFHGGGYVFGSIESHSLLIGRIARAARAPVFCINYRLAPEHPYPAQLEDARAAYTHLLESGVAPEHIVFAGDSAGGGLCLSTALSLRDDGAKLPAGIALMSPWTDITLSGGSLRQNHRFDYITERALRDSANLFAGKTRRDLPLLSPLFADHRGLPPLLIQAGGVESLLDDSLRLATRARAAGVPVELDVEADMIHVFQLFASLVPEARRAITRLGAFTERVTAMPPRPVPGRATRRRTTRSLRRNAPGPDA